MEDRSKSGRLKAKDARNWQEFGQTGGNFDGMWRPHVKIGTTPTPNILLYHLKVMSNQAFNANPTVYTSKKAHKSALPSKKSIWIDDVEEEEDESDEVEPIDQDEVFGA